MVPLPVAILLATCAVLIAFFAGLAIGDGKRDERREAEKLKCPWPLCAYPLPRTPLMRAKNNQLSQYVPEKCEGCGRGVGWSPSERCYVRYHGKAVDTTEGA